MHRFALILSLTLVLAFLTGLSVFAAPDDDVDDADRAQQIKDYLRSKDKPLNFYGLLVDNNNNAIPGAAITAQIEDSDGVKEVVAQTQADGTFEVVGQVGNSIVIADISCKGYEYKYKKTEQTSFENGSYVADKSKPMIYVARKKEPATLVVNRTLRWKVAPSVPYFEIDLVDIAYGKFGSLTKNNGHAHADIKLASKSNDDKSTLVTVTGLDDTGGIQILDELLYMVPESGYGKEASFIVPTGGKTLKHLYVKGRNGNIFSRVDFDFNDGNNGLIASASVFTNPNGLRNVDYDEDLYSQYIQQKSDDQMLENTKREEIKLNLYRK